MNHRIAAVSLVALLAACSNADIKPAEVNPTDMPKGPGLLSGESGNILDAFRNKGANGETAGNIGVNIYLWRAALESVSFMPIQQADSNGGVIATDWYTNPATPSERVKANILILGKSLRPEALKVSLFKQTKDKSGNWSSIPASAETERQLEDTILTKARALRVKTLAESR